MDFRRRSPGLLPGILVDGVQRNFLFLEPLDGFFEQLSAAHGVQDEFAVVRHELLEYGNRTCVHPHMRIGVCHDGSVEIDRYDCSFNGHIGYFF